MFTDIIIHMTLSKLERQSHLDLTDSCIELGSNSQQCRALLAHTVKTTIPKGMKIHLCHACNNDKCSNPKHLYWGTAKENFDDMVIRFGGIPGALATKGKKWSHSERTKRQMSATKKGRASNNIKGKNQYTPQ